MPQQGFNVENKDKTVMAFDSIAQLNGANWVQLLLMLFDTALIIAQLNGSNWLQLLCNAL